MKKNIDYKLFFSVLLLVVFGMIMISSVSVYSSFKVTNAKVIKGLISEAYNYYFVYKNIISIIVALLAMAFVVKINYKFFERYNKQIFFGAILLLTLVLFNGLTIKGATGWFKIPGIPFTLQPTEFFKLALIIFLAAFLKGNQAKLKDFKKGFLSFLIIIGIPTFIIGLQPDFGTLLVILPVSTIMFFYAGANIKHIIFLGVIGIVLFLSVYSIGKFYPKLGYITNRVDVFLVDRKEAIKNKTMEYQIEQGLIAIGSGGFKGRGFGKSIQKFGYLPEAQGDFIFSVIVEELGFMGGTVLIFFYLYIGYRGFHIATNVKDNFASYTAIGITSRILFQAFINISVNLNIIPPTGKTLPFISYGGSSLLSLMIALGILLSISRNIEEKKTYNRIDRKKLLF